MREGMKWTADELRLVVEHYHRVGGTNHSESHEAVQSLMKRLGRSWSAIRFVVADLQSMDLERNEELAPRGSALLRSVWETFESTHEQDPWLAVEGRAEIKVHQARERDPSIVRAKKGAHAQVFGRLPCEVCGFDFQLTFGNMGVGYAECHHTIPLSESGETTTTLDDLCIVCANCHSMLHRSDIAAPSALRAVTRSFWPTARVQLLEGCIQYPRDEEGYEYHPVDLSTARWLEAGAQLLAEWTEAGEDWSMRLESRDRSTYVGTHCTKHRRLRARMELWCGARGGVWELRGIYEDEGEQPWTLLLSDADRARA